MTIHDKLLGWYVDKINNNEYFSQGMYGDGEWIAIFKERVGKVNAENTIYDEKLCDELRKSLKFRSSNFYFSTSSGLKNAQWTGIGEKRIDNCLMELGISDIEFYEKDIWDKEVREMRFKPLIDALKKHRICIISN